MEERAHRLSAPIKGQGKKCKTLWKMEEALRSSSTAKLSGPAKKLLAIAGIRYEVSKEAYHPLLCTVEIKHKEQRRDALLERVRQEVKAIDEAERLERLQGTRVGTLQRARQAGELQQQMVSRKQAKREITKTCETKPICACVSPACYLHAWFGYFGAHRGNLGSTPRIQFDF